MARSGLLRAFGLVLGALVAIASAVRTGAEPVKGPEQSQAFDIAAQPLATAIHEYSVTTGIEVLYESAVTAHRQSPGVAGTYTPQQALAVLLEGSGLTAHAIAGGTITLSALPDRSAGPSLPAPTHAAYFASIQHSFESVFCRLPSGGWRNMRVLLKFRIASSGAIEELGIRGPAGQQDPDLVRALGHVRFRPPPPDLPQPVMILMVPRSPEQVLACP